MLRGCRNLLVLLTLVLNACTANAAERRKIIINQDCSGPGGSNMQTLLVLIQSPNVEVLGITVVSGNQWRDEEVARTLRLLEIIGRTDIPVIPGAAFPLVRNYEETLLWQDRYGKPAWRSLGFALLPWTICDSNASGRNAHDETVHRRCGSFSGANGSSVSERSHDL